MSLFLTIVAVWIGLNVAFVGLRAFVTRKARQRLTNARADYFAACLRGDTRKQKATLETFLSARHAQLAREIGWKAQR